MKKFLLLGILSVLFVSQSHAYGLRSFGNPEQESGLSVYFAVRGGVTYTKNTPDNALTYMSVVYDRVEYHDALKTYTIYGPSYLSPTDQELVTAGYTVDSRTMEYADFADWDAGEDMENFMGQFSIAFGGYLKQYSNVRVEIEATQYLDAKYNAKPYLKGLMYQDNALTTPVSGVDSNMTTALKSTVSSSSFMLNVMYDFASRMPKKGAFVPFVGFGLGLGINKTETTMVDPGGEVSEPNAPSLYIYGECTTTEDTDGKVISNNCTYKTTDNTQTSLAWSLMVGANYYLDVDSAVEIGLKFSDLGTTTWSIEDFDQTIGEDLMTTNHLFNTSLFIGYRKSF